MNLAVLIYRHEEERPVSIPTDWPSRVVELGSGTTLPGEDWVLMTKQSFTAYTGERVTNFVRWYEADRKKNVWI